MSRRIILWRHGRTGWNLAGRVQGQSDVPLDDVGVEQARESAARLATLGPTHILTSDLRRAADTAAALGDLCDVEVELDPRLREMNFGDREGLTWAEAWERMPDGMQAWVSGDESKIPGSETHAEAGERFATALREHVTRLGEDQTLVVVAHGGVARVGACSFLEFPPESWGAFGGLNNCAWSVLEEEHYGGRKRWRIVEWNAGTLPEPVMSDDERPGLGQTSASG
ncbi:histidine phosphatase family protein [Aeromicrobium sp.]|uniref:histidine phosphatase family protein n=1 Tax=Aeromicrobium sp. TaxID=1871063 RepID=UPI003D6C3901